MQKFSIAVAPAYLQIEDMVRLWNKDGNNGKNNNNAITVKNNAMTSNVEVPAKNNDSRESTPSKKGKKNKKLSDYLFINLYLCFIYILFSK